MIKHGNTTRLQPHLSELSEQMVPLLDLICQQNADVSFDIDAFRKTITSLKKNKAAK
jgi:hypothetical protein